MSGYKAKPKFGGRIPPAWSEDNDGQSLLGGLSFFTGRGLISKLIRKIVNKRNGFKPDRPPRPPRDAYTVEID
jgi:hypothetical protein